MQICLFRVPDIDNLKFDRTTFDRNDFLADIANIDGHKNTIRMVKMFNDDKSIVTACDDTYMRIFDVGSGFVSNSLKMSKSVCAVNVSYDNNVIMGLSSDGLFNVFDIRSGSVVHEHQIKHVCTAMSINFSSKQYK